MGISKVSNRWLNRLYKSVAILLVFLAVLISAFRLFLPYAHNHRQDLQNYLNNSYNSNIIIGSLNMVWQGSGPSLVANNVSLLQTSTTEVFIKEIDFNIDFWRSLRQQKIVTQDFTLEGVKVLLDRKTLSNSSGENTIQAQEASLIENISELFLNHIGQFSLINSQVIVQNNAEQRTFLIDQLNWANQGEKHFAQGQVILDGVTSNNVKLQLAITGEDLPNMKGQLYVKGNQLNITPWLDKVLELEDTDVTSSINFDAWLNIDNGQPTSLQVELGDNNIDWQVGDDSSSFEISKGQILTLFNLESNELSFASSQMKFSYNGFDWPVFEFHGVKSQNDLELYISKVDLAHLSALLPLAKIEHDNKTLLADLNMQGQINNFYLKNTTFNNSASFELSNYQHDSALGIPSIEHINGDVVINNGKFAVNLSGAEGQMDFNGLFNRPVPYSLLTTQVNGAFSEDSWFVNVEALNLTSNELSLDLSMQLNKPKSSPLNLALLASINNGDAQYANHYYPEKLMGDELVNYLNNALVKGALPQANVLINGPIQEFPFKNNQGTFVVDAELENGVFKFDPQWPAITSFDANLNFTNNSMMITGRKGMLSGLDVEGVQTSIKELVGTQELIVDAQFTNTQPETIAGLMNASPMADSVGITLDKINASGAVSGNFSLLLPLKMPTDVVAKGDIKLTNNKINLSAPEMAITNVNGQISFNNDLVTSKGLTAKWRDFPIEVSVFAQDQGEHYLTQLDLKGDWSKSHWKKEVPVNLQKYIEGNAKWHGQLALKNQQSGEFSYLFELDADLKNNQLNLPQPFNKKVAQEELFEVNVKGNASNSTITAALGSDLNFHGELDHNQVQFTSAHLVLGHEHMFIPTSGFYITSKLEHGVLNEWQPLVVDILDSINMANVESNTPALIGAPERIRGQVDKFDVETLTFNDVNFSFTDETAWWLLELTAVETNADIKFYPNWHNQGVDINAEFIHIPPTQEPKNKAEDVKGIGKKEADEQIVSVDKTPIIDINSTQQHAFFQSIPPISLTCKSCQIGQLNLGELKFDIRRENENLLSIDRLVAKRNKDELNLTGQWSFDGHKSTTNIAGKIGINDVEQNLEALGFASIIKDSGLSAVVDVSWQGGPHQFSVDSLNGNVETKLDDGYLAEVSDKGARIFSVLSLQSLLRKLTLDFRDIFSDGMFYSEIKGDMQIKDGVLYTQNTKMKGAAGDLIMQGNTQLADGILDYRMSYKPNLTSSLPVLAWIATLNPVTFLAGVAIDEVFTSKVVSEFKFELTGNVNEPNLRQVDKKTLDISVGRSSPPQIVNNVSTKDAVNNSDALKNGENQNKVQEEKNDG